MCEYQCLFSHHTNCEKACCHGDLCNEVSFGGYKGTTGKPALSSTKKYTQNPTTPPRSDSTKGSQSTRNPTVTQTTTDAPVTTHKVSTAEGGPLVGGPPTRPGCQDYREQCAEYAAYPGYCQYTRAFMLSNCPWSCRFCVDGTTKASTKSPLRTTTTSPTTQGVRTTSNAGNGGVGGPTGCVDARVRCVYFANVDGYCGYHRGFMLTYCPRSCNFCDQVQLPESPVKITDKPTTSEPEINVDDLFRPKPTPFGPGGEEYEIHLNNGCIDLRENCTFYAKTYDEYCDYNKEFMKIYCPFSCGFCGTSVSSEAFPHPPVIHQHRVSDEEFPAPPSKKDVKWITSFCSECHNGLQECIPKCILLLNDGIYEPTSNDVCLQLLGKANEIVPC
ncbi:Hypothetical predicted protein [Paramuricea clavata]|uniref:Uncharacterized protein n=1 Tax=Paramuricea clavata TaxID=317549 RepID=A0A7D9DCP6_PARCT|nr:Hypothetical predicted protein [Paramuricea clavata]